MVWRSISELDDGWYYIFNTTLKKNAELIYLVTDELQALLKIYMYEM